MNMPLASLPASERAWQWWQAAWALFLRSPRVFFVLGFAYLAFNVLVALFALKGWQLPALALSSLGQPLFIAYLARYIRVVHQPKERAGLPAGQVRVLLRIGMIGFCLSLVGSVLEGGLLQVGGELWALLFAFLLLLVWGMFFWCAPHLVIWGHHPAVKALVFSFLTVCFNWRPILCALFLFLSSIIGPFFLIALLQDKILLAILCVGWLPVVVMVYFCLIYQMYLDFFPFPAHVSEHA